MTLKNALEIAANGIDRKMRKEMVESFLATEYWQAADILATELIRLRGKLESISNILNENNQS